MWCINCNNFICDISRNTSIIGGVCNQVCNNSCNSSILGGNYNCMCNSCNSVILGGDHLIVCNMNDTVMVPNLATGTVSNATASQWKLGKPISSTASVDTSQYVEVMIDGTIYKLVVSL